MRDHCGQCLIKMSDNLYIIKLYTRYEQLFYFVFDTKVQIQFFYSKLQASQLLVLETNETDCCVLYSQFTPPDMLQIDGRVPSHWVVTDCLRSKKWVGQS